MKVILISIAYGLLQIISHLRLKGSNHVWNICRHAFFDSVCESPLSLMLIWIKVVNHVIGNHEVVQQEHKSMKAQPILSSLVDFLVLQHGPMKYFVLHKSKVHNFYQDGHQKEEWIIVQLYCIITLYNRKIGIMTN